MASSLRRGRTSSFNRGMALFRWAPAFPFGFAGDTLNRLHRGGFVPSPPIQTVSTYSFGRRRRGTVSCSVRRACRKRKRSNGHGKTSAKERRRPRRRANSCTRRSSTFVRESTGRDPRSRRLRSGFEGSAGGSETAAAETGRYLGGDPQAGAARSGKGKSGAEEAIGQAVAGDDEGVEEGRARARRPSRLCRGRRRARRGREKARVGVRLGGINPSGPGAFRGLRWGA